MHKYPKIRAMWANTPQKIVHDVVTEPVSCGAALHFGTEVNQVPSQCGPYARCSLGKTGVKTGGVRALGGAGNCLNAGWYPPKTSGPESPKGSPIPNHRTALPTAGKRRQPL